MTKSPWQLNAALLISIIYIIFCLNPLYSEGSRELAPNPNTLIDGSITNDVAALHIANPQFNNFAAYDNTNITSRLNIHISDPSRECIYLGFSEGHLNRTSPMPPAQDFEYRILDPNGNIVFGPVSILAGNADIQNWAEAVSGPSALVGPTGYTGVQVNSAELSSMGWTGRGDYYIEFLNLSSNDPFLIDYWDITVADCSSSVPAAKTGRVWSNNWALFAINDFGFPNRPFNGSFFVCAPDPTDQDAAFITKIDFNGSGFRPAAFNVAFNSFGTMNSGNIFEDRKSVENQNVTEAEYAIFLNDPIDICRTAQGGDVELLGISSCDGENFCIKFISTRPGQIDLFLDFDQRDNIFTAGTADLAISATIDSSQVGKELCIDWDGVDGLGVQLSGTAVEVPVNFSFAQGIYHFPIYDAELMTQGFEITAVRPTGPDPLLYYDDSNISVSSGTGEPVVQLSGCDLPCHGWTNYTNPGTVGFGNLNTINSWWFSTRLSFQSVFILPGQLECSIEGPLELCSGDSIILNANLQMIPEGSSFEIIGQSWSLESTGEVIAENVDSIFVFEGGTYQYNYEWLSAAGDTCNNSFCSFDVIEFPSYTINIDTLISFGDSIEVNDEVYSQAGTYLQEFSTINACDSTIIIIVELEDPVYTCEIIGDAEICFGDTSLLEVITLLDPPGAQALPIESIEWDGPGIIGNNTGESILALLQGDYSATVTWSNSEGELQKTSCTFFLDLNPRFAINIDTLLTEGDTLNIEGLTITETGVYDRVFQTVNGCDSTIFINVISQNAVVRYDFDDCKSIDYERFVGEYSSPVICAEFNASNVFRTNPEINGHSCTPGIGGGVAVCISSLDDCNYDAGNEKSLIFELEVIPQPDSAIQITGLNFFEKAPENFLYVVGFSGPNNYPLLYGFRVLRDGAEIYRRVDIPTSRDWTSKIFSFANDDDFLVESPSIFRFELLPYCLSGVDSYVTAWDIDELSIQASCGLGTLKKTHVNGTLSSRYGPNLIDFKVIMSQELAQTVQNEYYTDGNGEYAFKVPEGSGYTLQPISKDDYRKGVSTIDLIMIQRHILGQQRFTDPYDFIAADADASNSVTATDILALQKLILGIDESLPNNTSWRFNETQNNTSLDNPWQINEKIRVEYNPNQDTVIHDFDGVKIGDLNGDYFAGSNKKVTSKLTNLNVVDRVISKGSIVEFDIDLETTFTLSGLQMALELKNLQILDLKLDNFDAQWHLDGQVLKMSILNWARVDDKNIPISIKCIAGMSGYLSDHLQLKRDWNNQIYFEDNSISNDFSLNYKSVENLRDLTVMPNPFADQAIIYFQSEEEGVMDLALFSVDGRLVLSKRILATKGINKVSVTSSEMNNYQGILHGLIESNGFKKYFKLVSL